MNIRVDLLHLPDGTNGILFNIIDILRVANQLWRFRHPGQRGVLFRWQIIDAHGAPLPLPGWLAGSEAPGGPLPPPSRSVLLVPGLMMQNVPDLERQLERAEAARACIARYHAQGRVVATLFNGTALLARCGILAGRRATISWIIANWFATRFPDVQLTMESPVVADAGIFTTCTPAAHYELATELIRHFAGPELAQTVHNVLLHNPMRFEQAGLSITGLSIQTRDSVVFKAKRWLRAHIQTPYQLAAVAAAASVSPRTLLRHFQEVDGHSPLEYLHLLRIERAKQLLEVTLIELAEIMEYCGYHDPSAFRRLFRAATGLTPSAYRRNYTLRANRQFWRADDIHSEDLISELGFPAPAKPD